MSTSIFLARLIGPVMLVIGLAVFANQRGSATWPRNSWPAGR